MIHQLEHGYVRVRPLYHALAFNLEIDSILDGNTRGQVYVDDPAAPRRALIWDQMNALFLAGQADNAGFNAALNHLLTTQLIPDAIERHLDDFILYTDHEAWERALDVVLQGFAPFEARRRLYKLGRLQVDWRAQLPPGTRMARVDRNLLADERLENRIQVVNWITSFWPSSEDFLARGLGFCLIEGQTIASWCLAVFASGNRFEFGTETVAAYRRRGFSTLVTAAGVDHCLAHNVTPSWHCWDNNAASIGVAEKVGFQQVKTYTVRRFGFTPFDHLILQAEHFYNYYDFGRAAALVEAAFQVQAPPNKFYHYFAARLWARAGSPELAFRYLDQAIDAGWDDAGRLQADPDLSELHRTDAWAVLLARLETAP